MEVEKGKLTKVTAGVLMGSAFRALTLKYSINRGYGVEFDRRSFDGTIADDSIRLLKRKSN